MRCCIKNEWQMSQKSLKNHPKMNQKSTKIYQKSTKNLLKSALGPQEAPRPPQDPSKPENRRKSVSPRGSLLGGFSGHFGLQEPLEDYSKTIQNFHWFGSPSFIDFPRFWPGFGRILEPSWPPKSILKIGSRRWPNFCLNFDRSWDAFYWILLRSWKAGRPKNLDFP